jgi:hypothetical protein
MIRPTPIALQYVHFHILSIDGARVSGIGFILHATINGM